jgi:hypothetical protein
MIETVLDILLIFALAVTADFTFSQWRSSRSPSKQLPPEVVQKRWLNREARNAREAVNPVRLWSDQTSVQSLTKFMALDETVGLSTRAASYQSGGQPHYGHQSVPWFRSARRGGSCP